MLNGRKKEKKKDRGMPPSAYVIMPHYFPTEQVDIVKKIKLKKEERKK